MSHAKNYLLLWALLWAPGVRAQAEPPAQGEAAPAQAPAEEEDAAPAAVEEEDSAGEASSSEPAADEITARMDALMDRMVQARTRLSALGEALYATRVRVTLDHRVEGFRVERVRLFLDGAPVYEGDGRGLTRKQDVELFAGFAAPGMHALRIEVQHVRSEDGRYGYTVEQSFRFHAVEDQRTSLRLRMDDASDDVEEFEEDRDGEYDVRTRLQVRAEPLGER